MSYKDEERKERRAARKFDRFEKRAARKAEREAKGTPIPGTGRKMTGDEMFAKDSVGGMRRAYKKDKLMAAMQKRMQEDNFTKIPGTGREYTAAEIDRLAPMGFESAGQVKRNYFKQGRQEARAAAASARAYRKGKMS